MSAPETAPTGWPLVHVMLRGLWPAGTDPYGKVQQVAYELFLKGKVKSVAFDGDPADLVLQALDRFSGKTAFRPSAHEVWDECRNILGIGPGFDAPSWPEVYERCEEAAHRNRRNKDRAVASIEASLGPVVAAWFAHYAYAEFLAPGAAFGCEDYGDRNRAALRETYEEFVDKQRERRRRDLPVSTVASVGGAARGELAA